MPQVEDSPGWLLFLSYVSLSHSSADTDSGIPKSTQIDGLAPSGRVIESPTIMVYVIGRRHPRCGFEAVSLVTTDSQHDGLGEVTGNAQDFSNTIGIAQEWGCHSSPPRGACTAILTQSSSVSKGTGRSKSMRRRTAFVLVSSSIASIFSLRLFVSMTHLAKLRLPGIIDREPMPRSPEKEICKSLRPNRVCSNRSLIQCR